MTLVVPVVVCRTAFGITPPPAPKTQPTALTLTVPGGTGAELAIYTDDQGRMRLLAPRSWSCSAMYGADGSGGITVYPTGESVPSGWDAGWKVSATSPVQAVIGSQTSACFGCTVGQACPLFGSAATEFTANFGRPCPAVRPAAETTAKLRPGVIAFADPPGVHGDGSPSGGRYPANGVMTFYPGNENGSWVETCTLPPARKGLCTAALDFFLNSYGDR